MERNRDIERDERLKVYELGFHFVPTLSDDDVTVKFSELKSFVEKLGGEFISEDAPKLINLAYDISKTVKAVKKWYKEAYFGWVKFTLMPEDITALEKQVKEFESVLRYLLITTVRENTVIGDVRERNSRNDRGEHTDDDTPLDSDKAETLEETAVEAPAPATDDTLEA